MEIKAKLKLFFAQHANTATKRYKGIKHKNTQKLKLKTFKIIFILRIFNIYYVKHFKCFTVTSPLKIFIQEKHRKRKRRFNCTGRRNLFLRFTTSPLALVRDSSKVLWELRKSGSDEYWFFFEFITKRCRIKNH